MGEKLPVPPEKVAKFRAKGIELGVNATYDSDTGEIEEAPVALPPPEVQDRARYTGLGTFPRQFAGNVLPAAAGIGTTALLAAAPFTGGSSLIPLGAGMLIGGATKYLQDRALKGYSEKYPKGMVADYVAGSEYDVKEHPYASALSALPAGGFMKGGSFIPRPSTAIQNIPQALKMGAVNVGTDVGMQMYNNKSFDPTSSI